MLPQLESPAWRASKIIGALATGNLTKAMAQLTSFGVAPTTDATVNTITEMLRPTMTSCLKGSTTWQVGQEDPSNYEK